MGFRFQRRIRIAPGVRLNFSKSGIGASLGRTGLRVGMDAKRRKYYWVGLPGTGLSYRSFFGRRVEAATLRKLAVCAAIAGTLLFGVLIGLAVRK